MIWLMSTMHRASEAYLTQTKRPLRDVSGLPANFYVMRSLPAALIAQSTVGLDSG
jgi:hypothetical protein